MAVSTAFFHTSHVPFVVTSRATRRGDSYPEDRGFSVSGNKVVVCVLAFLWPSVAWLELDHDQRRMNFLGLISPLSLHGRGKRWIAMWATSVVRRRRDYRAIWVALCEGLRWSTDGQSELSTLSQHLVAGQRQQDTRSFGTTMRVPSGVPRFYSCSASLRVDKWTNEFLDSPFLFRHNRTTNED